jgi:hypothetical protein
MFMQSSDIVCGSREGDLNSARAVRSARGNFGERPRQKGLERVKRTDVAVTRMQETSFIHAFPELCPRDVRTLRSWIVAVVIWPSFRRQASLPFPK